MKIIKRQYITALDYERAQYENCVFSSEVLLSNETMNHRSAIINCTFKAETIINELCLRFKDCFFVKCLFKQQNFDTGIFNDCIFFDCELDSVDLNGTIFSHCTFCKTKLIDNVTSPIFIDCTFDDIKPFEPFEIF